MNQVKFVCLVIAMLCAIPCFGKRVPLNGGWWRPHRSVIIDVPVEASIEESSNILQINFHDDLGLVFITISDEAGNIVYHEPMSATENSYLSIPLNELFNKGIISISDGKNKVYGYINF